ncbi:transposase [Dyadobacter sp. CY323]|uniref:transposase n=1 Tax=Dyadobacter sp. CY323 TaxID=2907302 RepID=UPI0038D4469A
MGYHGLNSDYEHRIVGHQKQEYVNENGDTTNTLEGFWTIFKWLHIGIYHIMSRKHMQFYANEVAFRYITRKLKDGVRWNYAMAFIGGSNKYNELTER